MADLTLGPLQKLGGDQALDSPVHLLEVEQHAVPVTLPLPVKVISDHGLGKSSTKSQTYLLGYLQQLSSRVISMSLV